MYFTLTSATPSRRLPLLSRNYSPCVFLSPSRALSRAPRYSIIQTSSCAHFADQRDNSRISNLSAPSKRSFDELSTIVIAIKCPPLGGEFLRDGTCETDFRPSSSGDRVRFSPTEGPKYIARYQIIRKISRLRRCAR